jgi:alkylation response protein AidB-like acyl-CoA dehydrogenase
MDLRLSDEQEQLVDAFAGLYARHASPERVRAVEPLGFDRTLWGQVHAIGAVAMAVGEADGGWGASPLDLALVAEQHGRFVAPAPVIETQVAARLLARVGGDRAAGVLRAALAGDRMVTLALHAARTGQARLVPAAAVADDAVVCDGDRLLLVALEDARTVVENLGSMPVADVVLPNDAEVLASGPDAITAFDAAIDDFLVLTAAALAGIGARALEIGVEYVKERKAWGVPIGSFQSIAHRLADAATAVDGARLLAYEAAWAATADPIRAAELAAMAFAFAYESARDATYRSLHYHGGYGFMMEHDAQLYYRRARAWANVFAEPRLVYRRVADRRYGQRAHGEATGAVSSVPSIEEQGG